VPLIVEKADAAGLRTVAHIETAHDFRVALNAGVDEVAHMAGYSINTKNPRETETDYNVEDEALAAAAEAGLVVTPTFYRAIQMIPYIPEAYRPDSARVQQAKDFHRDAIRRLHDHGVSLVIGGDSPGLSPLDEAKYFHKLGALDNLALLRMLSVATPRRIFPERQIGCLEENCEASFLALVSNPLEDVAQIRNVAVRVKGGRFVEMSEE
jgi:imidazolonepropionase-like amidohydrolase